MIPHDYMEPSFDFRSPAYGQYTWPGWNAGYFRAPRYGYSTRTSDWRLKRRAHKRMRAAQSATSRKINRK